MLNSYLVSRIARIDGFSIPLSSFRQVFWSTQAEFTNPTHHSKCRGITFKSGFSNPFFANFIVFFFIFSLEIKSAHNQLILPLSLFGFLPIRSYFLLFIIVAQKLYGHELPED